jgi:hypothetical protein
MLSVVIPARNEEGLRRHCTVSRTPCAAPGSTTKSWSSTTTAMMPPCSPRYSGCYFCGVLGNFGVGWTKSPRATGCRPTEMIAITFLLAVSITDTLLEAAFAT